MNSTQLYDNEYALFYRNYIKGLGEVNLSEVLESSKNEMISLVENCPSEKLTFRYAEGKWTIKELIQHIIDAERVLSYRALRFSRQDVLELHGFDEDWYVDHSNGNERSIDELLKEFISLRTSTQFLFKSFTPSMLMETGQANGSEVSVRALGFIIAGHQMHHIKIINERYL